MAKKSIICLKSYIFASEAVYFRKKVLISRFNRYTFKLPIMCFSKKIGSFYQNEGKPLLFTRE